MDKVAYEKNLVDNVIDSIERHGGKNCLSSIILTGSFGRGEPTYVMDANRDIQLKSDVEIALVFPKPAQKGNVETLIQKVSAEFTEDLNLMAVNEKRVRKAYNFNFSLRTPKYKTIFTYDLFNGSRTIWGRNFIGEKEITLDDVDLYEAKRLVANRIGELTYLQDTADSDKQDYLRMQWKGKLVLAVVSAWLICEGEYVSSYHGQYEKIKKRKEEAERVIGKDFFEEYDKVFNVLRENGEAYEVPDKILINYVKNMDQYFRKKEIKKPKVNSISRMMKHTLKYVKSGMGYGFLGFENNILQSLIFDFWKKSERLSMDADTWHKVLY